MSISRSRRAYQMLEEQIVTHVLTPGERVTEGRLIALAGQGRTPVREAIQKLSWQGLILVKPRVGLQIAPMDTGDRSAVLDIRLRLEPRAAALAAEAVPARDHAGLSDCAGALTAAVIAGDIRLYLAACRMLEESVERRCANPFLNATLVPLRSHARRIWFGAAQAGDMDRALGSHMALIRALQVSDPVAAEAAMDVLVRITGAVGAAGR